MTDRFTKGVLLAGGLVLMLALGACSPDRITAESPLDEFTRALDEEVPRLLKRYGVPGVALAIIQDGEPAWSGAYGFADPADGRPMTVGTIFRTESISKPVTAWGVMRLVEEGRIDIDAPLATVLPNLRFGSSPYDEDAVLVEQLLSHRSGLPLGTIGPPSEYVPGAPRPSPREFVETDARLIAEPGTGFRYSDVGYNTLELVVEAATGEEFVRFMKREVLAPIGMSHSSYAWHPSYETDLAVGHELDGSPVGPYVYPAHASGGLFGNVEDVARFVAAGMTTGTGAGAGVLTEDSLRRMYAPRAEIPGLYGFVADAYGYGHFVEALPDGRTAVWHGGQGHGWMTHFHAVPESGKGLVILTNSQRSWPLVAALLPQWAEWSGVGSVRFGIITSATRILWGIIAAVALLTVIMAYRVVGGLLAGTRRWAPVSGSKPLSRAGRAVLGAGLVVFVLWRISLPYVDEASIFPAAAPWAAVALIALGVVTICSAVTARVR